MSTYTEWLGSAAGDMATTEIDDFTTAANNYYALPFHGQRDPEDQAANLAEDDEALTAILQTILDDDSLTRAAARYHQAQSELDAWVRAAYVLGATENEISEQSGYARMTVRKRLGK